jgi:putative tributyrin esterase
VPVVVLLHGAYGSHWVWAFRGGVHRIAAAMIAGGVVEPMVLVMPSDGHWGASSGYFTQPWADYESWILDEVVTCATEQLPGVGPRSPLFLAGLSMGGFGAMRLGAKHAARVSGVSAHSAITHVDELVHFAEPGSRLPPAPSAGEADVRHWLLRQRAELPPLRFDCGSADPLCLANRRLHAVLTAARIPHEFEEHPGGHDWTYWSARLPDTLAFFDRIAREKRDLYLRAEAGGAGG